MGRMDTRKMDLWVRFDLARVAASMLQFSPPSVVAAILLRMFGLELARAALTNARAMAAAIVNEYAEHTHVLAGTAEVVEEIKTEATAALEQLAVLERVAVDPSVLLTIMLEGFAVVGVEVVEDDGEPVRLPDGSIVAFGSPEHLAALAAGAGAELGRLDRLASSDRLEHRAALEAGAEHARLERDRLERECDRACPMPGLGSWARMDAGEIEGLEDVIRERGGSPVRVAYEAGQASGRGVELACARAWLEDASAQIRLEATADAASTGDAATVEITEWLHSFCGELFDRIVIGLGRGEHRPDGLPVEPPRPGSVADRLLEAEPEGCPDDCEECIALHGRVEDVRSELRTLGLDLDTEFADGPGEGAWDADDEIEAAANPATRGLAPTAGVLVVDPGERPIEAILERPIELPIEPLSSRGSALARRR
jgi:hypothetical protein